MLKLTALAPAKINLTFDILGVMPDGYHQVETILQSIDLADRLAFDIEPANELDVRLKADRAEMPTDESNLIAKAAKAFCENAKTGSKVRLVAQVEKNIPIGAGLAGGSADAAATLSALNHAFDEPLSDGDMLALAAQVGADVPFALKGGTAFGINKGELLSPVENKLEFVLCIVKPLAFSVSTPWAYKRFDEREWPNTKPQTQQALDALACGDIGAALKSFGNSFQGMLFIEHPILAEVKDELLRLGAWYVQLSGSGPAMFAIVPDLEHAHFLRRKMSDKYASKLEFHFCRTTREGVRIMEYEHGKATC